MEEMQIERIVITSNDKKYNTMKNIKCKDTIYPLVEPQEQEPFHAEV
jgi:hypothetical protein